VLAEAVSVVVYRNSTDGDVGILELELTRFR
jgi:hypothetical protein